jgi:hypothetical protein
LDKRYDSITESLEILKGLGYTPKELLEATKEFYKKHSEGTKDSCIPRVRTPLSFRKQVEECAKLSNKSLTDYIYDAVQKENKHKLQILLWGDKNETRTQG